MPFLALTTLIEILKLTIIEPRLKTNTKCLPASTDDKHNNNNR